MLRMVMALLVSATALLVLGGWTRLTGAPVAQASPPAIETPGQWSLKSEPARLCGTNSSRSRRCNFGNRDCIRNGRSAADCHKALTICRACIDVMTACSSNASVPCSECFARYDGCMETWAKLVSSP